jgi:hypothetical protein
MAAFSFPSVPPRRETGAAVGGPPFEHFVKNNRKDNRQEDRLLEAGKRRQDAETAYSKMEYHHSNDSIKNYDPMVIVFIINLIFESKTPFLIQKSNMCTT